MPKHYVLNMGVTNILTLRNHECKHFLVIIGLVCGGPHIFPPIRVRGHLVRVNKIALENHATIQSNLIQSL